MCPSTPALESVIESETSSQGMHVGWEIILLTVHDINAYIWFKLKVPCVAAQWQRQIV